MAPRKPIKRTFEQKKSPKAKSGDGFLKKLKNLLTDERTHYIVALFILLVTIYLFLAFTSYFFTGAADQSKLDISWNELKNVRAEIHNWTSVAGAYIAERAINRWFGISSFATLVFLFIMALRMMRKRIAPLWKTFFHCSFWLIWLSVTLAFVSFPAVKETLFFSLGGQHGDFASKWLTSYIGIPGTLLLLSGILLLYCIISFKQTIPFIKKLFTRKPKEKVYYGTSDIDDEPSVAVGTEIIPEDWVVKGGEEDAFTTHTKQKNDDVTLEIITTKENSTLEEIEKIELKIQPTEPDDPYYNLEKLGRYDPTLDLSHYKPPVLELLKIYNTDNGTHIDMVEQNANKERIITTLQNYGIAIDTIKATVGPTITLYEIVPKAGVRIAKIRNLEYDIMLSLAATGIRIIAPIPGKGTIGIEVPNSDPQVVSMHSVIASKKFQESKFDLPVAFGRTITNEVFMIDLAKMPHLLVAGATGQGKSVGLNAIITSLLYKKHPSELKLVLVDPKKVEFNIYGDIEKHFLAKLPDGEDAIITDTSKVVETLNSLCKEMDDRYDLLEKAKTRNIKEYNEKFFNRQLNPEKGHRFLPYIVVIVDEFGDLIMTAGK